jgi:dTDP-4-amino-4,6-dideoxygalactose transaminase
VYHVYAVRTRERERLMKELGEQGIQTGIHYPVPVHLQPAYADLTWSNGSFPHSEKAADEVLSLPMYPEMTEDHLQAVSQAVHGR